MPRLKPKPGYFIDDRRELKQIKPDGTPVWSKPKYVKATWQNLREIEDGKRQILTAGLMMKCETRADEIRVKWEGDFQLYWIKQSEFRTMLKHRLAEIPQNARYRNVERDGPIYPTVSDIIQPVRSDT